MCHESGTHMQVRMCGAHTHMQILGTTFQLVMQQGTLGWPRSSIFRTSPSRRDTSLNVKTAVSEQISSPPAAGLKRRERKLTLLLVNERIHPLVCVFVCVFVLVFACAQEDMLAQKPARVLWEHRMLGC